MATKKDNFSKVIANQNALTEKLTANTKKIVDLYQVNDKFAKMNKDLVDTYVQKGNEFAKEISKPVNAEKVMEEIPAKVNKAIKVQSDLYNSTVNFYKNIWSQYTVKNYTEKFEQTAEIYQDSLKAIAETTTENVKAVQEAFNK